MTKRQILIKIDHVFLELKEFTNLSASVNDEFIRNLIVNKHPEYNIDALTLRNIINKLIKDEYLTIRKATNKDDVDTFHVTFQGQLFDGYIDQWERENAEKQRILALEETNRDIVNKTYILNKWVMVTAIVSAISALASAIASLYPILKVK